MSGMAQSTISLRRSHIRYIAKTTQTPAPAALILDDLVHLFSARDWSREHRKAMRTSLCSFCGWCVDRGHMDTNLGSELPKVRASRPAPRPATDQQWANLLAHAEPREQLMGRLAGELGLRRGEVAQLHHRDLIRDRNGWMLIVTGKGNKQRVVPVPPGLAADIHNFCPESGWVFPNHIGGHLSAAYVGQLISRLLGPATMHQLRHRFATNAYSATHDIRALQRVLGHESLGTTQRYVAGCASDDRALVDAANRG